MRQQGELFVEKYIRIFGGGFYAREIWEAWLTLSQTFAYCAQDYYRNNGTCELNDKTTFICLLEVSQMNNKIKEI